jgi:PAS domain-containing protein
LKLIHELEVHQIELEMQNEELLLAKSKRNKQLKYTKLYDYAPSGYFTLSQDGKVTEANLTGAHMLGKMRSSILNSQFGFFLDHKIYLMIFLAKIFKSNVRELCEVNFIINE